MTKTKRVLIGFLLIFILLFASAATWLYSQIDGSLPLLNGKETLWGLIDTTIIERDKQGIVTIKATNRQDIALATGFVHAQERFFQMDLLRRNSAGELSSLFGKAAVNYDKKIRQHRFRERARKIIQQLSKDELALLKAYTLGVNQGLNYLKSSPFEYLLLNQAPVEWREEDSILVVFSMYIDLQQRNVKREKTLGLLHAVLSPQAYDFLNPKGSRWDAAIDGSRYLPSPIPQNNWLLSPSTIPTRLPSTSKNNLNLDDYFVGSNNWAISAQLSASGYAMIANDMHLGLRVPNTWFRASFEYPLEGENIKITGVTLPGTPNIVVGSNRNIAWGFTNSYGDWSDLIILQLSADKQQYLTPDGYKFFDYNQQVIAVKDQASTSIEVQETIWGPVIGKNHLGQLLVHRWVAHDTNAVNFSHTYLEQAHTVDEAFRIAAHSGIPAQNMLVADTTGQIGWTIMGPIPRKIGATGELPQDWATGENSWQGYLTYADYPRIKNPSNHRLWTANSRVVGGEMYKKIGHGGYALGARAQQIRDNLLAKNQFDEKSLLAIALDDKALFLQRWQKFLLTKVLTTNSLASHPMFNQAKKILLSQQPLSAAVDSVAYRLVRNFRLNVKRSVFQALNNQLTHIHNDYDFATIDHQLETPLWQLITQQPDNFLAHSEKNWQTLFEKALNKTLTDMSKNQPLAEATWGKLNLSKIVHPLSEALPLLGKFLNMPEVPLAGDSYMPRVQGQRFGASERMVVAPGHEEEGVFHMPTSQASHPWSPYYRQGHNDWLKGKASPFLPDKTKYSLTLLSY
jgi:penicillin amidase